MFYVYIISNKSDGTLYIGQTDDLVKRMWEHKQRLRSGFATKYNLDKLIWFDVFNAREDAFATERRMKSWKRQWKINLIEKQNPDWIDLTQTLSIM